MRGGKIGHIVSKEARLKISLGNKGRTAWNKGLTKETDKRVKKYSQGHSERMKKLWVDGKYINRDTSWGKINGERQRGENNPSWKGENAVIRKYFNGNQYAYIKLHQKINKLKGYPKICEKCNSLNNLNWANKSHEYKEDLDDWISLCVKCHKKYDNSDVK